MRDALGTVGLLETVLTMPDGLDTPLVSGGEPLSRTQIQRLMLARAIAGRPRLLVVDGALDGLSDDDSAKLAEQILSNDKEWTVVIATGRESIAELCNQRLNLGTGPAPVNRLDSTVGI